MANFEIAVFVTQDVYDDNGYQARDKVVTFIEGAFGETSRHSANVIAASETPYAPQEKVHDSFTGHCICDWRIECSWDNLLDWWDDWLIYSECNDPHTQAEDCNLLISAASGGGLGGGRNSPPGTAVSGGGTYLDDLPSSYERFVWTPAGHKMWVLLQEVGHTLIDDMDDGDGDGAGHDSGKVVEDSSVGKYSITPMGLTGNATWNYKHLNNCNHAYKKSKADNDGDGDIDGRNACFYNDDCTTAYFTKLEAQ